MIPYFEWKTIALGPITIYVWGMFAALGIVAAVWFALREGKKRGFDTIKLEALACWTVLWAFIGARMFHVIFYAPAYYWAHPFESLAIWNGGFSSFGGFFFAAAAAAWQIRKLKLPFLKTADLAMPAVALGLGCGRIGCFLIHDHPGTLAHGAGKWLAVNYSDGPRYDLGMLLGVFDFLLFGLFLILLRKPRKDGFYFALFMLVYGPVRFMLDFLRAIDVRYFGLTPGQYGSLVIFALGCYIALRNRRGGLGDENHYGERKIVPELGRVRAQ